MAVTLAEGRQQGSQWHKKKIKTKAQNNKCYREKWGLENLTLKYNQRQLREEKKKKTCVMVPTTGKWKKGLKS